MLPQKPPEKKGENFAKIRYAMQTFGIDIRKIEDEETLLLQKIRNYKPPKEIVEDFSDKTGTHWNIDEDCSEKLI